jgi:hypothetical protein
VRHSQRLHAAAWMLEAMREYLADVGENPMTDHEGGAAGQVLISALMEDDVNEDVPVIDRAVARALAMGGTSELGEQALRIASGLADVELLVPRTRAALRAIWERRFQPPRRRLLINLTTSPRRTWTEGFAVSVGDRGYYVVDKIDAGALVPPFAAHARRMYEFVSAWRRDYEEAIVFCGPADVVPSDLPVVVRERRVRVADGGTAIRPRDGDESYLGDER